MLSYTGEFAISAEQSQQFAQLSGDFNPLHVDEVAARRTQYGSTVVHGIHLVLKTFDIITGEWDLLKWQVAGISSTFNNPVRTSSIVRIRGQFEEDRMRIRVSAETQNNPAFTLILDLKPVQSAQVHSFADQIFAANAPDADSFPPQKRAGNVPLRLHQSTVLRLFPRLGHSQELVADLLATTQIVGMKCPGVDSIFSTLKLKRTEAGSTEQASSMRYQVTKTDDRFNMVRVEVMGATYGGSIDAFFRARPVTQKKLTEILSLVSPGQFRNQHALVVGGSRGLGEVTAKLLLAGDATVTITYARGQADAQRIADEATQSGKRCAIAELKTNRLDDVLQLWLQNGGFTHVYYFASPPIAKNQSGHWQPTQFDVYTATYVDAFAALAETLLTAKTTNANKTQFFYPSTIFLQGAEPGFAEYCVAKAAGESLCQALAAQYKTNIATPRLPRMRTDQTSSLTDSDAPDALPIMLDALKTFTS